MKKTFISLMLVLAMLATCLSGCEFPNFTVAGDPETDPKVEAAAAIFTLDVNPGVRIYVDENGIVIEVEATNEDGEIVVEKLEFENKDYETIIEQIIDMLEEMGYIPEDESSILISLEKKELDDISDKINEKIEKTFEKHGKRAAVIEQELDKLADDVSKEIKDMAEKHHISEGKAHLIEKIREEFPELSEEELAKLNVNELGMILHETSEDIKEHFKKMDEPVRGEYISKDEALAEALATLEIDLENVTMLRVRLSRGEGKMVFDVMFVYNELEYHMILDAQNGDICSIESNEYVELDMEAIMKDFCDKHDVDPENIKDMIIDSIFNRGDHDKDPAGDGTHPEGEQLTKSELLKGILTELGISDDMIKRTDVRACEIENGMVFVVTIENCEGNVYTLIVEAYSGAIIKAELDGVAIEIGIEITE